MTTYEKYDRVPVGTPITTEQAVRALLREIHSPIVGDIEAAPTPGYTLRRIQKDSYPFLSSGEKKLVDVAQSIWQGPTPGGAYVNALGGFDRTTRRKVLLVLLYFYLGRDVPVDMVADQFWAMFGKATA